MSEAAGDLSDLVGGPLAALLAARGIGRDEPVWAFRITLDPRDRCPEHPTLAALVARGHDRAYSRMQEGMRLGSGRAILAFAAEPGGRARLRGFRRYLARRPGVAPGDLVYDYDVHDLFHGFIARSHRPVFYDALDLPGLDDLVDRLVVAWPRPAMVALRPADHPGLTIAAFAP